MQHTKSLAVLKYAICVLLVRYAALTRIPSHKRSDVLHTRLCIANSTTYDRVIELSSAKGCLSNVNV
jgi:hypothetical protein